MSLAGVSKNIDTELAKELEVWKEEIAEKQRVIEAQIKILQSSEAQTDRSENALFQNASDTLQQATMDKSLLEDKIKMYERNYSLYAFENYEPTDRIKIGSTVRFAVKDTGKEYTVKIVPAKADSPMKGAISSTSIAGSALLNKRAGDSAKCVTVRGERLYEIREVY